MLPAGWSVSVLHTVCSDSIPCEEDSFCFSWLFLRGVYGQQELAGELPNLSFSCFSSLGLCFYLSSRSPSLTSLYNREHLVVFVFKGALLYLQVGA